MHNGFGIKINTNSRFELVRVEDGYTPEWWDGGVYATRGDGNPISALMKHTVSQSMSSAYDYYITDHINLKEFTIPVNITAQNFRVFTRVITSGIWRFLLYRRSDRSKIWDSGFVNTLEKSWNTYSMNGLSLLADTPYWFTVCTINQIHEATPLWITKNAAMHYKQYNNGAAPFGNLGIGLPADITGWFSSNQNGVVPDIIPPSNYESGLWGINIDIPIGFITTF